VKDGSDRSALLYRLRESNALFSVDLDRVLHALKVTAFKRRDDSEAFKQIADHIASGGVVQFWAEGEGGVRAARHLERSAEWDADCCSALLGLLQDCDLLVAVQDKASA
jgi:hypothetical protein